MSASLFGPGGFDVASDGSLVVPGENGEVFVVDPPTGASQTVATLPDNAWTDGFALDSVNGLAYHHGPGGVYEVDLASGSYSRARVPIGLFGPGGFGVVVPIPEPESIALLGIALAALASTRQRLPEKAVNRQTARPRWSSRRPVRT